MACVVDDAKERLACQPNKIAIQTVNTLLEADATNRYQAAKTSDPKGMEVKPNCMLRCEKALADYFKKKYAIGVASGGLAIMLGLKALKRCYIDRHASEKGDNVEVPNREVRVYSNSFTFNAVPSAIVNAGFKPILCETMPDLTIDLADLERRVCDDKAKGYRHQILVLSYMRARVPDMDVVMQMCTKHGVLLLEDNAHGYGVSWRRTRVGSFGLVSTISTQSNKLINTGEGGFIFTDCPHLQSFFMFSAGCYEQRFAKHEVLCPPRAVLDLYRFTVPNYSCRMSNVTAAVAEPQIEILQDRIDMHNKLYYQLKQEVETGLGVRALEFIDQLPEVEPVYDSLQIRFHGQPSVKDTCKATSDFVRLMKERGYEMQAFLDPENARYYKSWKYCETDTLPHTEKNLMNVVDMRLSCTDTPARMSETANAMMQCYTEAISLSG